MGKVLQAIRVHIPVVVNIEDFWPLGLLSTCKEEPDSEEETKMPATPLRETHNLRRCLNMIVAIMKINLMIHFLSVIGQVKQQEVYYHEF